MDSRGRTTKVITALGCWCLYKHPPPHAAVGRPSGDPPTDRPACLPQRGIPLASRARGHCTLLGQPVTEATSESSELPSKVQCQGKRCNGCHRESCTEESRRQRWPRRRLPSGPPWARSKAELPSNMIMPLMKTHGPISDDGREDCLRRIITSKSHMASLSKSTASHTQRHTTRSKQISGPTYLEPKWLRNIYIYT